MRKTIAVFFLPRLSDLVFIVIFAGALALGPRMLNTDGDLGRHLTLGNYILNTHQIPTRNILSFTQAGQPRPPYEWLAQVLFAIAHRLLSLDGVVLLTSLIVAATFLLVYKDASRRSQTVLVPIFLAMWAAAASSIHWLTRPHIFSFLFFAIWLGLLEQVRKNEKVRLWFFPTLMLIWANTHGGFIYGILAWAVYLAGWLWERLRKSADQETGRRFLLIGASSLLASIITPDNWHNWEAVLNNRSQFILVHTVETTPPNPAAPETWPYFGLLALAILLLTFLLFAARSQLKASHVLLLGGLAAMSLLMARNIPFFVIAAAPILAEWVRTIGQRAGYWLKSEEGFGKIDNMGRGFFWAILIPLTAVGLFSYHYRTTRMPLFQFSPSVFPVRAVYWIKNHPLQGNMFNDFNWGGYLLYRLWPGQRVFIDSQSDFYGEAFTRQYEEIYNGGENWEEELNQYNVNWIIVPRDAGLANVVRSSPNWQLVYEDNLAVVFIRSRHQHRSQHQVKSP